VIKAKWELGYKLFSHENGQNFFEKDWQEFLLKWKLWFLDA